VDDLLLDACVAINLVASGLDFQEVTKASNVRFVMTSIAAAEMLWIDPLQQGGERERIDLAALAEGGALSLVELSHEELDQFVALAQDIDDGEASTLSVAICRTIRVATDDRRAQRLAAGLDPPVAIVGTAGLIRSWAERSGFDPQRAARAVRSIERRASYIPRRGDPNLDWWTSARSK